MQNDGKLVLTDVLLETIWYMMPGYNHNNANTIFSPSTTTLTDPNYSLPTTFVDESKNGGTFVYTPPTASVVTVVPEAGTIMWPLGSVVQCLLNNGSLGTAYLSIPTSADKVRD